MSHKSYSEDEVIDYEDILKEAARKRQGFNEKQVPVAGIKPAWCIKPADF